MYVSLFDTRVNFFLQDTVFRNIILHYLSSSSALQRVITAVTAEECAKEVNAASPKGTRSLDSSFANGIAEMLLTVIGQSPLSCYLETLPNLRRLSIDCSTLLNKFATSGFVATTEIPNVTLEVDVTGLRTGMFCVEIAKDVAGPIFDKLRPKLTKMKKKELATFDALRTSLLSHIDSWNASKDKYEVRVLASAAAALVALESVPSKAGNVIKNIMNGIKVDSFDHLVVVF
jgi:TATA-binding protein-associated factor